MVILLAGVTGAWALLRDEDAPTPAQNAAAAPTTTTPPPTTTPAPPTTAAPPQAVVATAAVSQIGVFESPSDAAPIKTTLSDRTEYGVVRTLLVTDQDVPGWLQVLLPLKPNGQSGWIHDGDVTRSLVSYEIKVSLAEHKLTLLNLGQVVLETPVAVGASGTPTPTGLFYITDPVPSYEGSSYGPYALGLSGYSDVLAEFGGGPPQIAIHGTNRPDLIGQNVSNGCVRVPNDMILQIKDQVPLGTPVVIT